MYSKEHYEMLSRLEDGLVWIWHQDKGADEILRFLLDEGLCETRADIKPGWLQLTQKGRGILARSRADSQKEEKEDSIALETLDLARKEARSSKRLSIAALIISVLAVLVELFK